jgi:hypothetical protein
MAKPALPALSTLDPSKLNKRAFFEEYQRLAQAFRDDASNPGSYACEGCSRCTGCMFCNGCVNCYRCNHCTGCKDCNHCTHSEACVSCHGCAYCYQSELCTGSQYLSFCRNCSDCTYCFGCVGLSRKDFHILNVPYSRKEFFELVKRLKAELGIR